MEVSLDYPRTDGSCFRDALVDAAKAGLVDPVKLKMLIDSGELPDWIVVEKNPAICEKLGIRFHGEGAHTFEDNQPVIISYLTGNDKAHAVFVPMKKHFASTDYKLVAIISFPQVKKEPRA